MYKHMRKARRATGVRPGRGDTIVEVLISIAIISVVITGAYSIANRSLHQGISASEHTEALNLATGQLEALKFREQKSTTADFNSNFANFSAGGYPNFCLSTAAAGPSDTTNWPPLTNGTNPSSLTLIGVPGGNYNTKCVSPAAPAAPKYFININVSQPGGTGQPLYHITVQWNAIGGGTDQSQLYYRF